MKGVVLVPTDLFSKFFSVAKVSFSNKSNYQAPTTLGGCEKFFQAKYGDTLESIAAKQHMKIDALIDLNPSIRYVRPGMTINVCDLK